jgi:polyphosphate kinase
MGAALGQTIHLGDQDLMTDSADKASLPLLDRDVGWLEFNQRVLHEAADQRTPLLERAKFLAIVSSNLDEFFMKRIGLLTRQMWQQSSALTPEPSAYREEQVLREKIQAMIAAQADIFRRVLRPELARHGVHLLEWAELTAEEQRQAHAVFRQKIYPVLTPLVVDPSHPFPFLSNLSQSLGVLLKNPGTGQTEFARIKAPGHVAAWLNLETGDAAHPHNSGQSLRFFRLLDVIRANLNELFPEMQILEVMPFRVTRNAQLEDDEDIIEGSLAEHVAEELRQRRMEEVVRLEYEPPASATQLALLTDRLDLDDLLVYEVPAPMDFTGLFPIANLPRPDLRDPPWEPIVPAALADTEGSIFSTIKTGDILVHHPYESFDATTARFIRSACEDPNVLAVKMTVYRVGSDTPFIGSLIHAAEAGKQVACLVEVTARFDEMQNLKWAQALDKAGVHVVYGILGYKTHCKTTLVVRNEADGVRCYAHIGTGNYHIKTARLYTDLGLLTCNPVLTADVVELFHSLTGGSRNRPYAKLLVAPVNMRDRFLALIDREIEHRQAGRPAHIIARMNQLEDRTICRALVRASQAGVPIDLIIRGFCVLPPGVPGYTERVHVISIIGRFLEHSRIYYFQNGSADPIQGEYFIGSADWMQRNLSQRVEAITPVETPTLRQRLWQILQICLEDHRQAWDMHADGSYVQRTPVDGAEGSARIGTQATLMALAQKQDGELKETESS